MNIRQKLVLTLSILGLSAIISLFIKYQGESLAIAPTATNALIGIFGLPLVVGIALWWRAKREYLRSN